MGVLVAKDPSPSLESGNWQKYECMSNICVNNELLLLERERESYTLPSLLRDKGYITKINDIMDGRVKTTEQV